MKFDEATLAILRDVRVLRIVTSSATGVEHRTAVWVVADEHDAYLRSVRGTRGRWYRELRDRPEGALVLGDERLPVRAVAAVDPATIELVSDLLRAKYGRSSPGSTASMLNPETLPTTLRLEPA